MSFFNKPRTVTPYLPSAYAPYSRSRNLNVYRNQQHAGQTRQAQQSAYMGRAKALFLLTLLAVVIGYAVWAQHASAEKVAAHQAQTVLAVQRERIFRSQVNALIADNPTMTVSVSTISQAGGLQHYGSTSTFDAASIAKLLTAADFLHHVSLHAASLRQNIDGQTAEYWLRNMLVNSDDTAWYELNALLTHGNLDDYADGINVTNYDADSNTLSSNDVARLLQKLYTGQLLDNQGRSLMLGYLEQANYRNFIVGAVPIDDTIYHKVGEDGDDVHDAAIISHGQESMILVIFTNGNGSYDWATRAQLMQAITRDALKAYLS